MFNRCNGLRLNGLPHVNSPRVHITITACNGVIVSNLHIIAPETSPNTDGIRDSIIGTVEVHLISKSVASREGRAMESVNNLFRSCSIGALGKGGVDVVENIEVRNCTLRKTLAGVRIKSWQGGCGYARKISFKAIKFDAVYNPIIIDQYYCPTQKDCINSTSAIKLSDISYSGIMGTSNMDNVINLSRSESVACTNIAMDNACISSVTPGRKVSGKCINAHGRISHVKPLFNCLKP
ncbi:hypothetical protein L1987_49586 [Smallanthus sonchifolius]|uniref:Uncharacterized protein n=1 Tax=Smallanthus sonchifolius TaxID=185202 RepID=A0ACB9FVP7_9ASTR|nr:hypothetical protein L1987_49586 [Smallanthus sonchifolius]